MLTKLKRHSIRQLSLTIFLTLSLLMTTYYCFYNQILSKDYIDKATSLSEIYSQNINNYLKRLDKNTSTFINYFDIGTYESFEQPEFRSYIIDALSDITKYQVNETITDIILIFNEDNYIANNPYIIDMEAIRQTGILETLKSSPSCVYFNPDAKIYFGNTGNKRYFLYGKTIYSLDGSLLYYVLETIDVDLFLDKIREETYFTKNASVYIKFDNAYLTVTENDKTKLNPAIFDNNKPIPQKNIKTVSIHNNNYNIDVVTNISPTDKAVFISSLKNIFILLCIIVSILGLFFSKRIVEHIIYPLEKTYVEINKSTFKQR